MIKNKSGVFRPKDMTTLKDCMKALIGQSFEWEYAGTSDEDEPYPGQVRWMISRRHDAALTDKQIGRWVPEEDIEFAR